MNILSSIRFVFLLNLKILGKLFYYPTITWHKNKLPKWDDISLILILNHTSLFEFVFCIVLPFKFIWKISRSLILPVAEKTMKKKFSGLLFSFIAPKTISLTRKRDNSWQKFINAIEENDICIFMPEGRMKRPNGLDLSGKAMTVKTGVYELLRKFPHKKVLIVHSHGLHHVLAPGQRFPRIFKKIKAHMEVLNIDDYLRKFQDSDEPWKLVAHDLENKRDVYT